ncbi:MAG: flagellin [Pseudomonadota bacterium]|nr:flagellin [Pseudomonadota bacterium]
MTSINTNPGALVALQNLNSISARLEEVQRRVSTGLEVSSAKDNPTLYTLAQQQRAQLGSLESVRQGLRVGVSTVDVALAAGESISDVLVEMRAIASQAADPSKSQADRDALGQQYVALREQLERLVDSASIGGRNLIANGANDLVVVASDDGSSTITVAAQDLSVGGGNVTISASATPFAAMADDPGTAGVDESAPGYAAQLEIAAIDESIANVTNALAQMGAGGKALTLQNKILSRVADSLEISIGNLVDADLAKESSRLQALQVQQQLAIQVLSIANAAPNSILALFA